MGQILALGRAHSFAVDPNNEDFLITSQINPCYISTDRGTNWTSQSWDKHDDSHWIKFDPSGEEIWIATDGGVNKSTDYGANWENKTNNMGVSSMYNIGSGNVLFNEILYGGFDCGTSLYKNSTWIQVGDKGDSYDCAINDMDINNPVYFMTTQGSMRKSTNGCSFSPIYIPSEIGFNDFEQLFVKAYKLQSTLYYAGKNRIGRTTNNGSDWESISFYVKEENFIYYPDREFYAVFNSINDPDYLYASTMGSTSDQGAFRLFKSTNCTSTNVTWTDLTPTINNVRLNRWVGGVAIDEDNPEKIWVCYEGYYTHPDYPKVMYFDGSTWTDITGGYDENSPLYGINVCRIVQIMNTDIILIGTSAGLFYKQGTNEWTHLDGLPNCHIKDMDINYFGNKLRIATYGRGLWETDIPCIYSETPLEISSNTTWDKDKRLSSDVIITDGATLTIESRVSIPTDAKIIVEPGSKLLVDGGILTNACNDGLWGGIEVQGDPNQMQDDPDYQGYVELKNSAIIENANIGIHCVLNAYTPGDDPVTLYASGGIINTDGVTFRNNKTAIQIEPYKPGYTYNSIIANSTFEYPNEIGPSTEWPLYYIKLNSVKGVNIFGNTFTGGNSSNFGSRGTGIEALDATINLNPEGDEPDPNTFADLTYGIRCLNTNSSINPEISLSTFTNCWRSIYLSGVTDAHVLVNDIDFKSLSSTAGLEAYGIYLDNCTDYWVEGNIMTGSNPYPENGLVINNSGSNYNRIYRNTFENIQVPINAQNINRNSWMNTGLEILCNTITNCTVNDIVVTKDPNHPVPYACGIKQDQGSYNPFFPRPAGNLFTYATDYINYTNSTPNIVYYAHYYQDGEIQYQNISHYVTPKLNDMSALVQNQNTNIPWSTSRWENTDCYHTPGLPGDESKNLKGIDDYKLLISQLQPRIDSSLTALNNKMDNGSTATLINRITGCQPSGFGNLYADLRKYSPYLSEEALLALIQKQAFPRMMLYNLMLINTQVAKSPLLMDALKALQPPLSNVQLKNITDKYKVFSTMELDRKNIGLLLNKRDDAYNWLESYYAHDSLVSSYDSLGIVLKRDPRLSSKYRLVNYYLAKDDTLASDALFNNIPSMFSFNNYEQTEYSKYKQLYQLSRQLRSTGKTFGMMNEQQQQMLINAINDPSLSLGEMKDLNALRHCGNVIIGKTAKAGGKSLVLNYNEPILKPLENKDVIADNTTGNNNEELQMQSILDKLLMEQNNMQLYPNPATQEVNVLYNTSYGSSTAMIEIIDITGKSLYTFTADTNNNLIKIKTSAYNKGIYYIVLYVDSKKQKVEKLVIQ
jgi:hypothetical protein